MGQRHQLFVIAKVKGRYRTLCAIHHQWLYGHTALRRCLGTLKIFQDPANHLPIQQELLAAQRHDDSFWVYSNNEEYNEKNSHVPFPFIATCLTVGASYDPSGYFHSTSIEPFYMPFCGGDNNNGITIFDITNLSHVSYCFVDFYGMESERKVPLMTPLSARTYLEAYYELNDPKHSEELLPLVESFRGWGLILASVLEDAWPGESWEEAETDVQEGKGTEPDLQLEKLEIAHRPSLDTLRGQTMDTVIQSLLDSPEENSGLVVEAENLSDFLPRLKDKLYAAATTIEWSSHYLDLLSQALKTEVEVDLSPLSNIPAKDLAIVVAKLYENGKMNVLNLSHRPDISLEDLRSIVGTGPRLRVLCLLEMPQIPLENLGHFLVNYEVHHSDLMRSALKGFRDYGERLPNIGFPATGVISKIVWAGLGTSASVDRRNYLPNGRIAWENLSFSSRKAQFLDNWQALENRLYDSYVPVTPYKLVPSVLRLLQWFGPASLSWSTDVSRGLACSLASSLPCTNGNGHGISLLNPSLWLAGMLDWDSPKESCLSSLNAGEWALLLMSKSYDAFNQSYIDRMLKDSRTSSRAFSKSGVPVNVDPAEKLPNKSGDTASGSSSQAPEVDPTAPKDQDVEFRPCKAASYALITRVADSGPSQYMVADIPTFLEKVLGDTLEARELIDAWTSGISTIENAEFFGDDTYQILQKLSPEDGKPKGKEAQGVKQGAEHDGTGSSQVGGTGTGDDGAEID